MNNKLKFKNIRHGCMHVFGVWNHVCKSFSRPKTFLAWRQKLQDKVFRLTWFLAVILTHPLWYQTYTKQVFGTTFASHFRTLETFLMWRQKLQNYAFMLTWFLAVIFLKTLCSKHTSNLCLFPLLYFPESRLG